jgi:methionine synthase I (cobalamin-dependent)
MVAEPRGSALNPEGRFLAALRSGVVLVDGATGSLLFELTGRLSERNHVYEALNIENPDLVLQTHRLYLQAGAAALETNSFDSTSALGRHCSIFPQRRNFAKVLR